MRFIFPDGYYTVWSIWIRKSCRVALRTCGTIILLRFIILEGYDTDWSFWSGGPCRLEYRTSSADFLSSGLSDIDTGPGEKKAGTSEREKPEAKGKTYRINT